MKKPMYFKLKNLVFTRKKYFHCTHHQFIYHDAPRQLPIKIPFGRTKQYSTEKVHSGLYSGMNDTSKSKDKNVWQVPQDTFQFNYSAMIGMKCPHHCGNEHFKQVLAEHKEGCVHIPRWTIWTLYQAGRKELSA